MNFAAIDIGTNSIRLLIAEHNEGELNRLVNKLRTPRLGEGINDGIINSKAQKRAIGVLKEYQELVDSYQAHYRAVATSAIRDAENKEEFLNKTKEESGIKIDVINGLEEAELSYLGITSGLIKQEDNMLAVDIGGGSTEFIFGAIDGIREYKSINLGAVRLKESWKDDLEAMRSEAQSQVQEVLTDNKAEMLIGVGGTITTLASIDQNLEDYQPHKIQNYRLSFAEIGDILEQLKELNFAERKRIVGLAPDRADIIIPGIIILLEIMKASNLKRLQVSDFGILEGIIYNNIK
ncbi:MAG: Ppx/GppA phosphatase family protein [Halanaerobacter sp.]